MFHIVVLWQAGHDCGGTTVLSRLVLNDRQSKIEIKYD